MDDSDSDLSFADSWGYVTLSEHFKLVGKRYLCWADEELDLLPMDDKHQVPEIIIHDEAGRRFILHWELDGQTGLYTDEVCDDDIDNIGYNIYWHLVGSGSCDCNRATSAGLPKMECGERIKITKVEVLC